MAEAHAKQHDYHLVNPSPWPIVGGIGGLTLTIGAVCKALVQEFPDIVAPSPLLVLPDEPELDDQPSLFDVAETGDDAVYTLPDPGVLRRSKAAARGEAESSARVGEALVQALANFGVDASLVGEIAGPRVTRYELQLAPGTKVAKVAALKDDLSYALATTEIRILAPIPGKQAVGVEVLASLAKLDQVAYMRFASVYKDFQEVTDFERELGLADPVGRRHHRDLAAEHRDERGLRESCELTDMAMTANALSFGDRIPGISSAARARSRPSAPSERSTSSSWSCCRCSSARCSSTVALETNAGCDEAPHPCAQLPRRSRSC